MNFINKKPSETRRTIPVDPYTNRVEENWDKLEQYRASLDLPENRFLKLISEFVYIEEWADFKN